jgi:hypothetical protein
VGVIDFEAERLLRNPHRTGKARCLNCKHEWVAVAPVGTHALECSQCQTFQGVFIGASNTQFQQWQCCCGEYLFYIDAKGPYCAHCGTRPEHLTDIPPP